MVQIIPTLFALDEEQFKSKLEVLSFAKVIHIDVMDGNFVQSTSLDFKKIVSLLSQTSQKLEIHFMIHKPERHVFLCKTLHVSKVLIHYEAFRIKRERDACRRAFKKSGMKVFLAVNPSTNLNQYLSELSLYDGILFMSVRPGAEKQRLMPSVLKNVKQLKLLMHPHFVIQMDGGLNSETLLKAKQAGVSVFNVGSAISSAPDPQEAFEELEEQLKVASLAPKQEIEGTESGTFST